MLRKIESMISSEGQRVLDKEVEIVPRYQCRGKELEAAVRAGHTDPSRDSTEAKGPASSMQKAAGVTQRVPEDAQCLRGMTQRGQRLTQRSGGLTQCFSGAGEGFVGHVF